MGSVQNRIGFAVLGLALAVAAAASCSAAPMAEAPPALSEPGDDQTHGQEQPEDPAPTQVPEVLTWSAPRLGGGRIEGEDFAGRDLAMWFWAPW